MTWTELKVSWNSSTLPAGEYYIGDPCYALKDEDFDNTAMNGDGFYTDGENNLCIFSTAYGDGCYRDQKGRVYGVDSGTLSVIPTKICSETNMGTVLKFKNEFTAGCTTDGMLWINDFMNSENCLKIPTGEMDDSDDEDGYDPKYDNKHNYEEDEDDEDEDD